VANDLAEAVDWILEDLALSKVSDEIRREKA
jgi:hypothetical protein